MIRMDLRMVDATGRLTRAGYEALIVMERDLAAAKAKLDAISALTAPSGGATIDAQARASIAAIIAA
jgi:phosphoribosylformylglycinamidine (FGAM) synthase-like amidotransferase family enzyme